MKHALLVSSNSPLCTVLYLKLGILENINIENSDVNNIDERLNCTDFTTSYRETSLTHQSEN